MAGSVRRIREERARRMQEEREQRKRAEVLDRRAEEERARQRERERERLREQEKRAAAMELARSLDRAKELTGTRRQLEIERIRAERRTERHALVRKSARKETLLTVRREQRRSEAPETANELERERSLRDERRPVTAERRAATRPRSTPRIVEKAKRETAIRTLLRPKAEERVPSPRRKLRDMANRPLRPSIERTRVEIEPRKQAGTGRPVEAQKPPRAPEARQKRQADRPERAGLERRSEERRGSSDRPARPQSRPPIEVASFHKPPRTQAPPLPDVPGRPPLRIRETLPSRPPTQAPARRSEPLARPPLPGSSLAPSRLPSPDLRGRQRIGRAAREAPPTRNKGLARARTDTRAARAAIRPAIRPAPVASLFRTPLVDRIPSGSLSAALPWLRVTGNQVTTVVGVPILLRGVNLPGLEDAAPHPDRGFAAGAGITEQTIDDILSWGVNVIRLPINRARVISGAGGFSAWHYLEDLQWIIQRAAAGGAYTMLSLRRLDDSTIFGTLAGPGGAPIPNRIAPQPDYDAIGMWRLLGEHFAAEPAVLYDLYAAPHAALPDDLTGLDSDWERWTLWIDMMIAELRSQHPRALCVASGLGWGTDVGGFPVLGTESRPIPNLVYGVRHFPRKAVSWPAVRRLALGHPVFVTEWGGGDNDVLWGSYTAQSLRAEGVSWTAAHWTGEMPLTRRVHDRLTATAFGTVVRHALAVSGDRADSASGSLTPSTMIPPLPGETIERNRFF